MGTQLHDPINSVLKLWRLTVYLNAVAESGRKGKSPRICTRFSLGVENERANVGRDGRTCLARPNSQAWTGRVKVPCLAGHMQDWQPYPIDAMYAKRVDQQLWFAQYPSCAPEMSYASVILKFRNLPILLAEADPLHPYRRRLLNAHF